VANLDIKWPNDVLVNERKLCGILLEGVSSSPEAPRVIVGIGVNLNHQSFPPELSHTATSLRLECGERVEPGEFRDELLVTFARWYEIVCHRNEQMIINRWQELSSYARGKQVIVTLEDDQVSGETAGLTDAGALLLRTPAGEMRTILAGEVSKLRKNDA
jgi:BirA family biotin operon repressor/biotin-[acetyl-CoA-carboxylase] ligase